MHVTHVSRLVAILVFCLSGSSVHAQGYAPSEAARRMSVADGLEVTLFASEPEVRQPIFCKCDDRGRLWTIQYLQYPNPAGLKRISVDRYSRTVYDRKPEPPPHGPKGADRITIMEDTNGDGRADQFHDFVSGLNLCTGVEFGFGGVFVIQAPYLLFYPDRNQDDIPDTDPEVLLDGFGIEDSQSLANHLTWGPDGWLYGLNGSTTTCRIRGIEFQQGVWRYHPVTREFELFCEGGGNIFGLTFDRVGRLFYSSNGGLFYHGVQGGYYEKNFGKHGPLHNPYTYGYFSYVQHKGDTGRPNPGVTMYLGQSFPEYLHDTLMISDFLSHTCSWWKVQPRGSTVEAVLGGLLVESDDTWFGATDLCLGPDGAVYVTDFYDQRTAHPDPDAQWDTSNGRIYRLQNQAVEKSANPALNLSSRKTEELVGLLKSENGWLTQRARRILTERQDPEAVPLLKEMALNTDNHDLALQALWALNGISGIDEDTAVRLLRHPAEHVRSWTVRLQGDTGRITESVQKMLVEMATSDPDVIVRAQLAATAKRLPGKQSIPVIHAMLSRGEDSEDPYVPLLIWWAIEAKTISDRDVILSTLAVPESWKNPSFHADLLRLVRRYGSEGTPDAYDACQHLIKSAPESQQEVVLQALHQGLAERSGEASLSPATSQLKQTILTAWKKNPDNSLRTRLALQVRLDETYTHLLEKIGGQESATDLKDRLAILAVYGKEDCVEPVLPLLGESQPESVRMGAIDVLQRFAQPEISAAILRDFLTMSPAMQSRSRDVLFQRPQSTLAFLKLVEQKQVKPADVPLDQLRPLALFQNAEIDGLVRRFWGNIQPATPEERLADVRRFSNDLRAASGNPMDGKLIYAKHCGSCHKLHGEGTPIGPDLSGTVRGDQMSLLTNIVAPSSVVRLEYLSYIVTTTTGAIHTGLLVEQDAASVTLLDAKNQRTRLSRNDIEEMTESLVSLMPEKILEQLSPQQLRDLFAFLQQAPPSDAAK